jgi:hypothetical protein
MVPREIHSDDAQYRLALLLPDSRRVLAETVDGDYRLPRISIPRWNRPAEQITQAIQQKWGVRSIVLDLAAQDDDLEPPCAFTELRSRDWKFAAEGLEAVSTAELCEQELSPTERCRLYDILTEHGPASQPFARLGWIEEAQQWIRDSVGDGSVEFTDDIRQLNASGTFALVRFATQSGRAYWLKATGEPNRHELTITTTLSRLFPRYLPTLTATREDWNAWVTEEAGTSLRSSLSLPNCERAIVRLAELQLQSIGSIDPLREAGCPNLDMPVLANHLDEIFDSLKTAMEQQTSTRVPRLSVSRLDELQQLLFEACAEMRDLDIPDTLVHRDINPGNVILGEECTFIDWAEAAIGNPLLCCEQFLAHMERFGEEAQDWRSSLVKAYKQQWRDLLKEEQLDIARTLAPPLAIGSCLYGRGTWLTLPDRHVPEF